MLSAIARNMCLILAGVTLAVTAGFTISGDLPVLLAIPVGIAVTIVAVMGDQ